MATGKFIAMMKR